MFTSTGPLYLAELCLPAVRGRILSFQQWSITWGVSNTLDQLSHWTNTDFQGLIMYYITFGASYTNSEAAFRVPWAVQIAPAVVMFVALFFIPRSPRWLASQDRWEETLEVLTHLHGGGDPQAPIVQAQYAEIREAMSVSESEGKVRWVELIHHDNIHRISAGIFVHIWTQLTGNNAGSYCLYGLHKFES